MSAASSAARLPRLPCLVFCPACQAAAPLAVGQVWLGPSLAQKTTYATSFASLPAATHPPCSCFHCSAFTHVQECDQGERRASLQSANVHRMQHGAQPHRVLEKP